MAHTSPYIEKLKMNRQLKASTTKEQAEFKAMITEMRKTQAASLAGGTKPTVILTDQTDLGDKIKQLTTSLTEAVKSTDPKELNHDQLVKLIGIKGALDELNKNLADLAKATDKQTKQFVAAISKLELSPQITVPKPQVTITERPIDFKPLEKAINSLKPGKQQKAINLNDYRAQDLADTPDGKQYIGYMAADGTWYIAESDDTNQTMRYYFGAGSYDEAWEYRTGHEYKKLSEAVRGLAA